jgi:hypothetical protein
VLKWIVIVFVFLLPSFVRAQAPTEAESESDLADKSVCSKSGDAVRVAPNAKKVKEPKPKTLGDKVVPLTLVVCEVENALNAYQQSPEVTDETRKDVLPKIASADFDFKTVVDTKGQLGIGLFIFKILGGSIDKQKTDEVDFQYVPKSLLTTGFEARRAKTFQEELIDVIRNAAKAVKDQEGIPANPNDKDPLVFKQLTVTVSFGVTRAVQAGISIPISIITLTAELDHSTNSVQSVKLVFAPPPKKP